MPHLMGKVADSVLRIEGVPTASTSEAAATTPGKAPIVKRRRQGGEEVEVEDPMNVAASSGEDRRSQ